MINHCGNPEVQGRIGKTEVMVSNDLENKPGYAGFDTSKTYLTSTKAAVEAALLGTLGYKEEAPAAEEEETEIILSHLKDAAGSLEMILTQILSSQHST